MQQIKNIRASWPLIESLPPVPNLLGLQARAVKSLRLMFEAPKTLMNFKTAIVRWSSASESWKLIRSDWKSERLSLWSIPTLAHLSTLAHLRPSESISKTRPNLWATSSSAWRLGSKSMTESPLVASSEAWIEVDSASSSRKTLAELSSALESPSVRVTSRSCNECWTPNPRDTSNTDQSCNSSRACPLRSLSISQSWSCLSLLSAKTCCQKSSPDCLTLET